MEKDVKENRNAEFVDANDEHCEKVRRIIEQKPTFIVRWGNTCLLVVVLLLLLVVCLNALSAM